MAKKNPMKGMMGDAVTLTGTGMALGVGATAIGAAGGNPAVMTAMGGMMPIVGTATGAKYALGAVQGMMPPSNRRRRKY